MLVDKVSDELFLIDNARKTCRELSAVHWEQPRLDRFHGLSKDPEVGLCEVVVIDGFRPEQTLSQSRQPGRMGRRPGLVAESRQGFILLRNGLLGTPAF